MSAWLMRSALTTAPIVVRLRCSAIGPSSCWSATATAPSLPSVGILVLPVTMAGGAGGPGDAPGEPDGAGDPDGVADGVGEALGAGLALDAADAPALALAPGDPLAVAPDAAGLADGSGVWRSVSCSVLISMNSGPAFKATASRPCFANTASTWSGVTVGSSKRISQRVPPV